MAKLDKGQWEKVGHVSNASLDPAIEQRTCLPELLSPHTTHSMFWFLMSCPFCEFMLCEPGVVLCCSDRNSFLSIEFDCETDDRPPPPDPAPLPPPGCWPTLAIDEPPDEDEMKSFLSCAPPPPLDDEEEVCMPGTTEPPGGPWPPRVVMSSPAAVAVLLETGRCVPERVLGSRQAPCGGGGTRAIPRGKPSSSAPISEPWPRGFAYQPTVWLVPDTASFAQGKEISPARRGSNSSKSGKVQWVRLTLDEGLIAWGERAVLRQAVLGRDAENTCTIHWFTFAMLMFSRS
uniref:Uncharacterized protein n=1 Tax=Anopheles atroparvus TaxID=41427 RepID=A0A182J7M0_ANOAO